MIIWNLVLMQRRDLVDYAVSLRVLRHEFVINLENCRMYDRDYVKSLEQEIELSGGNRFEGWCLSTERGNTPEPKQPEQKTGTTQQPAHR